MARVNDNPSCPVCGSTAQREISTDTHEMTMGCDNCGFCADTEIKFDTTGYYFWQETKRYPMRRGMVHRGRYHDITAQDRLCDGVVEGEQSDNLETLCKGYLDARSRSARVDAAMALIDFVAHFKRASAVYTAMRDSESKWKN